VKKQLLMLFAFFIASLNILAGNSHTEWRRCKQLVTLENRSHHFYEILSQLEQKARRLGKSPEASRRYRKLSRRLYKTLTTISLLSLSREETIEYFRSL